MNLHGQRWTRLIDFAVMLALYAVLWPVKQVLVAVMHGWAWVSGDIKATCPTGSDNS